MDKLIRAIESTQARLDGLRKRCLKETPTRTIIIDPLLEALGWDVRDPDEVQLEYPTVDGKSVDYALLLNGKPVLLVEAKPLDDPLNDVKGITQVVGYAANDGIVWCVLTTGAVWRVYRSVEQCPAPDKLMFEVSLDPKAPEGLSIQQVASQMWRFSRAEMAKGSLDHVGEQIFTDGKVRKALDAVMRDAPRTLVNLVRAAAEDRQLSPQRIKESVARVWAENTPASSGLLPSGSAPSALQEVSPATQSDGGRPRKQRATATSTPYDESHHTAGKPQEVLGLYHAVDRLCLVLKPGHVERRYVAMTINYVCAKSIFCCVRLLQGGLRIWLKLKYSHLKNPPGIARDVSNVGHYGTGDVELGISSMSQLEEAAPLIRQSFDEQQS